MGGGGMWYGTGGQKYVKTVSRIIWMVPKIVFVYL